MARRGIGLHHGFAQYFEQAVDGVGAVAFLGAEALGVDHDHAFLGHALAGNPVQPQACVLRQRDLARIETELGCGRELVDVLPARAGGADEADLDIVLVDREVAGNPQHGVHRKSSCPGKSAKRVFAPDVPGIHVLSVSKGKNTWMAGSADKFT